MIAITRISPIPEGCRRKDKPINPLRTDNLEQGEEQTLKVRALSRRSPVCASVDQTCSSYQWADIISSLCYHWQERVASERSCLRERIKRNSRWGRRGLGILTLVQRDKVIPQSSKRAKAWGYYVQTNYGVSDLVGFNASQHVLTRAIPIDIVGLINFP